MFVVNLQHIPGEADHQEHIHQQPAMLIHGSSQTAGPPQKVLVHGPMDGTASL